MFSFIFLIIGSLLIYRSIFQTQYRAEVLQTLKSLSLDTCPKFCSLIMCFIIKTMGLTISPFLLITTPLSFIHPLINQHGFENIGMFANPHEALQCLHTPRTLDNLQALSSKLLKIFSTQPGECQ